MSFYLFKTMTFTVQFQQAWKDPRLTFDPSQWNMSSMHVLYAHTWIPDTFFPNEQSVVEHSAASVNDYTELSHDGDVFRHQRLTLKTSCPMDFSWFPMDYQTCSLEIESYGYQMNYLMYHWNQTQYPVSYSDSQMSDEEFTLLGIDTKTMHVTLSTGNRLFYFSFNLSVT